MIAGDTGRGRRRLDECDRGGSRGRDLARRRLDPTSTTNPEPHRLDDLPTRRVEDDPHQSTGEGSRPLPPAHAPVGGPRGVYLITNSRIFWVFTRLVW